jgi:hypothetical protein
VLAVGTTSENSFVYVGNKFHSTRSKEETTGPWEVQSREIDA